MSRYPVSIQRFLNRPDLFSQSCSRSLYVSLCHMKPKLAGYFSSPMSRHNHLSSPYPSLTLTLPHLTLLTTSSTALAKYSTFPVFSPAILILPFFVMYTCHLLRNSPTCFSFNPVKLNIPICSMIWSHFPGVPSLSKCPLSASRISTIRPDIVRRSSSHIANRLSSFRIFAAILAP